MYFLENLVLLMVEEKEFKTIKAPYDHFILK